MVVVGALMLAHVGYDLWGTGVATAHAQRDLRREFQSELRADGAGQTVVPLAGGAPSNLVRRRTVVPLVPHGVLGLIQIPRINLDLAFVQGVDPGSLALGPGHYPRTPLPGGGGNVAIAGHRTTHGAPFWSLNEVMPGDPIVLVTTAGRFEYRVQWVKVVPADGWWVVDQTPRPSLTLTTCNPRFFAYQRLVVRALLVSGQLRVAAPATG
jgi:sortase A